MRLFTLTSAIALTLSACAPTSQSPTISNEMAQNEAALQRELAVTENMKYARRLENIAAPILMANADLCGDKIAPYAGVQVLTQDSVGENYAITMKNLYGVDMWPTVTMVAEKSPADGKLQIGDIITYVDGEALPEGREGLDEFKKIIAQNNGTPLNLTTVRDGKSYLTKLTPVTACDSPVILTNSDAVNAAADGKKVMVTKGMMRFAENDTELATVIGHELAHNTRSHINAKRGNAIIGGVLGAAASVAIGVNITDLGAQMGGGMNSQSFEAEADYVGLYHTARAGYNIEEAPNLWRRMAASNPDAIHLKGTSHPSSAKRFLALEATVAEIKTKTSQNRPLIPEEQEVEKRKQGNVSDLNG